MAPPQDKKSLTTVESLRALPWELLRPSALIDFILLLSGGKPAARLLVKGEGEQHLLELLSVWCSERGLDFASDGEGFSCIALEGGEAERILELDRRPEAHEFELGLALGYPRCCCDRVAAAGESNVDAYAAEVAAWQFAGSYRRINPCGYRQGLALICHLPCSPACEASLAIANRTKEFLLAHKTEPILSRLLRYTLTSA